MTRRQGVTRFRHWLDNERAFTLAELLVVTAVLGLVMAGVFVLQQGGQQAYLLGSNRVETQQNARVALDLMTRELRSSPWSDNLASTTLASASDITFTDQSTPANKIQYCWSSSKTSCVSSGEPSYLVRHNFTDGSYTVVIGGVQSLAMAYYCATASTGAYTEKTAYPVTPSLVSVIKISLTTKSEESVASGMPDDQHAVVESTVTLRSALAKPAAC